jgi:DNA-binding LacI/PurR family transcriptional regulator
MARRAQVTAKDVARAAGVSQTTVSYVINDTPNQTISDATRGRVRSAIADLGYAPSAAARALRTGRSDLVLLVLPDLPLGTVVAGFIESFGDDLERAGLTLISRRLTDQRKLGSLWRELRPAAVVTLVRMSPAEEQAMTAQGVRHIGMLLTPTSAASTATVPQVMVGRLQVEHLAATGHRRIAYAALDDPRVGDFYALRLDGVRSACLDLGLDDPLLETVALDDVATEPAVRRWREAGVTAVAAYNDDVAFAVLAGMHRLGWTAPRDLAVIGVDNIPLARLASPPLTTIDQHLDQVAVHLTRQVLAEVRGEPAPEPMPPDPVTLVVRESA